METNNPFHMFKQFATSNYSYAVKFRQFAERVWPWFCRCITTIQMRILSIGNNKIRIN